MDTRCWVAEHPSTNIHHIGFLCTQTKNCAMSIGDTGHLCYNKQKTNEDFWSGIMEYLKDFFSRTYVRRILIFALIGGLLYWMKDLLSLFLLTFLFIYIVNSAQKFLYRHIKRIFPINRVFIVVLLYMVFLIFLVAALYVYVPVIAKETIAIFNKISLLYKNALSSNSGNFFVDSIVYIIRKIDLSPYYNSGSRFALSMLKDVGIFSMFTFFASILSMFFMLEKRKILSFVHGFRHSKISWLYDEISYFGVKFTNSFGKVIQTQILISLINAILSTLSLWLLGFPNLFGLSTMIFILGLIPVGGVFISLIPLATIAFNIGGVQKVVSVLILIVILHSLECYILNPKLMSEKTKLPVFFTFLVLIISEHFMGTWGLIIGIPITMFILDLLDIIPDESVKNTLPKVE